MYLYEKHYYLNKKIPFIINRNIYEVDMKNAGFTIIKEKKLLPDEIIKEIEPLEKKEKDIVIGKLSKEYKNLQKNLMEWFVQYRKYFVEENKIQNEDILTIKKDSFFIINYLPEKLKFDSIEYRVKNVFTSYYNLLEGKEFYLSKDNLIIKGLEKEIKEEQKDYWMAFLVDIFTQAEKRNKGLMKNLKDFRQAYVEKKLKYEFYKELRNKKYFYQTNMTILDKYITLIDIKKELLDYLIIDYNYINILLPLIKDFISYGFL